MNTNTIYNEPAINKAIARRCGFKQDPQDSNRFYKGKETYFSVPVFCELSLPSYTTSLDAMAEARKVLDDQNRLDYGLALDDFIYGSAFTHLWADELYAAADLKPIHHAIAFCKACGIWDEELMIERKG